MAGGPHGTRGPARHGRRRGVPAGSDHVAAEREGEWDEAPLQVPFGVLERLGGLADRLIDLRLDELSDLELERVLRGIQPTLVKLQALRTRGAGEVEARSVARAEPGHEQRAEQDARRFLRQQVGLTPGEAKRAATIGRQLRGSPTLGGAHAAGRISESHAGVIADMLSWLPDTVSPAQREAFESQLLVLAGELDIGSFGRKARRLLAMFDLQAAEGRERRQHERRSVRIATVEDGAVVGSFRMYGLPAEKFRAALDAATVPDPAGGPFRSPEQRHADGLEVLCDLALRSGDLPTRHGVRPHVSVVVEWSALAIGAGIAELAFTGPITIETLRPLLRDCTVSRIILGPDSVPIEAGEATRTVPAGFWRLLEARDRGCTWEGCDAIPAWCQVAHGQVPFRRGGRLRLEDAALLCVRHHRVFDSEPWRMVIRGPEVSYERVHT